MEYKSYNSLCIAGFVLAVTFPVLIFFPVIGMIALALPAVGLALSVAGVAKFKPESERGQGLGIAGIVISAVDLVIVIAIVMLFSAIVVNWRPKKDKIIKDTSDVTVVSVETDGQEVTDVSES